MRSDLLRRLAAGPVTPLWSVTAHHVDLPAPLYLPATDLQLVWDEDTAPRAELRLSGAVSTSVATLDVLDPRNGVRLHVTAGYRWPEGDDVEPIADLGLVTRTITYPQVSLVANSDEALILDNAPSNGGLAAASQRAAIQDVITMVLPSALIVTTAAAGTAVSIPSPQLGNKWAAIEDFADGIGDVDVYDDGTRRWFIEPRPTVAATPVATFTTGPGGLIIGAPRSTLDRKSFANRVYLEYKWTDAGGTAQRIGRTRSVTTGPYSINAAPIRTYYEQRDLPATNATADTACESILRRMVSRGRSLEFDAVCVPWLRPGMTIKVVLPWGETSTVLVSRVAMNGGGTMSVRTRYPDTSYTIGT